mmetsp:Transcript_42214/g.91997  ORF Transcript_42214/g.91997 Transcript_42214/m.91997 type:complete len:106 (-) Transcript_42214:89-406(-)|eukprot:CAMPEP_0170598792 /NCGR_PEP_ID=MMETSP0224-20130122/16437_1 /TAXON_ID=285029 /ORGANISM="Togula jolla, Strain CCCM 725" /LENGTH=105 /DNA_ID=CAMNT_0010923369 /DNA_START=66 /DNA_END=383 /DNA_ORIENTATION=+
MAARSALLPVVLAAVLFAGAVYQTVNFVEGARPGQSATALRGNTARRAFSPDSMPEVDTSVLTALAVSTPGWWANIVFVVIPCGFLIILYLQSERVRVAEEKGAK